MTTMTLWLLVALGHSSPSVAAVVVERFPNVQECERVRSTIERVRDSFPRLICVQATVVR